MINFAGHGDIRILKSLPTEACMFIIAYKVALNLKGTMAAQQFKHWTTYLVVPASSPT